MKLRTPILAILALLLALPVLSAPVLPAPHATIRQVAAPNPKIIVWVGDYVDSTGTDHPQAAYIPASIAIDQIGQDVGIQIYVYAAPAALVSVYQGKTLSPCGQHSYHVTKAQFPVMATSPVVNGTVASAIFGAVAQTAMTTQDVPSSNPDGTPALDAQGKPVLRSFVQGCTMQYLDLVTGALSPYIGS